MHPSPLISRKAVVECLEELADLVLICIGSRKNYNSFAEIEGRACCRFILCQFIVLVNIPWKLLCKEIPLKVFMHMGIEPHINKPPRACEVADGFT